MNGSVCPDQSIQTAARAIHKASAYFTMAFPFAVRGVQTRGRGTLATAARRSGATSVRPQPKTPTPLGRLIAELSADDIRRPKRPNIGCRLAADNRHFCDVAGSAPSPSPIAPPADRGRRPPKSPRCGAEPTGGKKLCEKKHELKFRSVDPLPGLR